MKFSSEGMCSFVFSDKVTTVMYTGTVKEVILCKGHESSSHLTCLRWMLVKSRKCGFEAKMHAMFDQIESIEVELLKLVSPEITRQ